MSDQAEDEDDWCPTCLGYRHVPNGVDDSEPCPTCNYDPAVHGDPI